VVQSIRVLAILTALIVPQLARADECGDAVVDYNAVLAKLNEATQSFSNCVANSLGTDSCSVEFRVLRQAQGEFESAIALYIKDCR
jgi:hypothetical protein